MAKSDENVSVLQGRVESRIRGDKHQMLSMNEDHMKSWIRNIFTAERHCQYFAEYAPELVAISPELVTLFAEICTKLQLTADIEFACFDTYDLYLYYNFEHMQRRCAMIRSTGAMKPEFGWIFVKKEFLANFDKNILCIVSVVSKFFGTNHFACALISKLWRKTEESEGVCTTLMQGELEVMKILNGKIRKSQAMESMEVFWVMCVQPLLPTRLHDIMCLSIKILRIVYLYRQEIYHPLKSRLKSTNQFHAIQTDKVLMGASVILSSVEYLQIQATIVEKLRISVAKLSNLAVNDIKTVSREIYRKAKSVFNENTTEEIV